MNTTPHLDLSRACLHASDSVMTRHGALIKMVLDEVAARSWVRWTPSHATPPTNCPIVFLNTREDNEQHTEPVVQRAFKALSSAPESFAISTDIRANGTQVAVVGADKRGLLFGIGRLLRELHYSRDAVVLLHPLDLAETPYHPIRQHQIGYRPKTNSYDGWTPQQYDQYVRDLAVFGTNGIQMIPPRSDDDDDSPHFTVPKLDMLAHVSQTADSYGLDFWLWYPAMDSDYSDREVVERALNEWREVFRALARLDGILVPGGDPGNTPPKLLLALLEKQAANLRAVHPNAQVWVTPQGFDQTELTEFIDLLVSQDMPWLSGVAFGPQVRISLPELRRAIPERYPIIRYDDLTHSMRCQYPVPQWDPAYALTENRECINPRPYGYSRIFRLWHDLTVGFVGYSEGCNDDVNKIIWSSLAWNPQQETIDILRQYTRYFIHSAWADELAQVLVALEKNWAGPLLTNTGVFTTLAQVQDMERLAPPHVLANWRFQQILYRAYYDAYIARRLIYETELEQEAMDALRSAAQIGTRLAMEQAEAFLARAVLQPVAPDWRARVFELAEALFQSIRMQLSVPRYKAIAWDRGANLDLIDRPLNNRLWLTEQFERIRVLPSEQERLDALNRVLNWSNPGPGGFYDNLGKETEQPHLVSETCWEDDPEFRSTPLLETPLFVPGYRMSWLTQAEARFDAPLTMRYTGLDPEASYKIRVTYAGIRLERRIRLEAEPHITIHPFITKPNPVQPLEFMIPREATKNGTLVLRWYQEPGSGGTGRGCDVSEVWLIKSPQT